MKKKILVLILAGVLAITLSGCWVASQLIGGKKPIEEEQELPEDEVTESEDTDGVITDGNPGKDNDRVEYENIELTPVDAFDLYMEKYPDTKIKKLELDRDNGSYYYKVKGFSGEDRYNIKINPITGEIFKEETDRDDDQEHEITKADAEKVQDIVDKVLLDMGEGAKIEEWTLEVEDGITQIEVEVEKSGSDDKEFVYDMEGNLLELDD